MKLTIPDPSYFSKFNLLILFKTIFLVLFLTLSNSTNLLGQVIIKDRVEINPSITTHGNNGVKMEVNLTPIPFYAYAVPNPVGIGNTSQINIKQFIDDVGYVDFPDDQKFHIELWCGDIFGSLYSSWANTTHDWIFEDTPGDFSFIAANDIGDRESAWVYVWVETILNISEDGTSSLTKSGANNKIVSKPTELQKKDVRAKLRKEIREKILTEKQQHMSNRLIFYEKDNITISQSNNGFVSLGTTSSSVLVSYEFKILVKKNVGDTCEEPIVDCNSNEPQNFNSEIAERDLGMG